MNKKTIAVLALLSLGGYAYSKGLFSKKIAIPEPLEPEEGEKEEAKPTPTYNPLADPNSFAYKVAFIQRKLGVAIDGKAGPQTNGSFDKVYGLDKGNINKSNIDYYVKRVKSNDTKSKNKDVIGDAFTIRTTYIQGGVLYFKNSAKVDVVEYDSARKMYIKTGTRKGYTAGGTFIIPATFSRDRVKIVTVLSNGNLIIRVNPAFGSQFMLSVPANVLIVKK